MPDGDYVGFLQRQGVVLTPGDFVDREGRVLGRHRGLPCYTAGQRKGLGVAAGKHVYVLRKNGEDNTILLGMTRSCTPPRCGPAMSNWISGETPAAGALRRQDAVQSDGIGLHRLSDAGRRAAGGVRPAAAGHHRRAGGGAVRRRGGAGRRHDRNRETERRERDAPPAVDKPIPTEHPKWCFAARSGTGNPNLFSKAKKIVKIVRFGNRLPRQSADWLAMTGFFTAWTERDALPLFYIL